MTVIIILIIASVVVAIGFLAAFFWAVRSGQYDDTYSPSVRILFDDEKLTKEKKDPKVLKSEKNHKRS